MTVRNLEEERVELKSLGGIRNEFNRYLEWADVDKAQFEDKNDADITEMSIESMSDADQIHYYQNRLYDFFMSDVYREYLADTNAINSLSRSIVPCLIVQASPDVEDTSEDWLLFIKHPFQKLSNISGFIDSLETGGVQVEYDAQREWIVTDTVHSQSVSVSLFPHTKLLEQLLVEFPRFPSVWDTLEKSELDSYCKMSVDTVSESEVEGSYVLTVEDLDSSWDLELVGWDESHPTVKLLNSYGYGDPSEIDWVYVRPNNPNRNSSETIVSNDGLWEIPVEKPTLSATTTADSETGIIDRFIVPILVTMAVVISLIILIHNPVLVPILVTMAVVTFLSISILVLVNRAV
jgi:hypothetical protein